MQNPSELMRELHDVLHMAIQETSGTEALDVVPDVIPITPFPWPWLITASGLYEWKFSFPLIPTPLPQPFPPIGNGNGQHNAEEAGASDGQIELTPFWFQREELRLDVDGRYPLMRVSGTIYSGLALRVHWIADLKQTGTNTYAGPIWYKDGSSSWLPQTQVVVQVTKSFFPASRQVTVTFSGGGVANRVRTYKWLSAYFHPVDFEYDTVQGTSAVTEINTGAHPNRPSALPVENLSIETVYRRAGFDVTTSPAGGVPISAAGADAAWSDMEMHDAMQVYWSHFANVAQWRLWVLFASLHETGTSLGGIMFDDIGPNHRQGTALFNDAFIKNPPAGDANPAAWVQRMKFWTACHEMGHAFNLAHSWQKALGTPWIPLANEAEARSFMNYPYNVAGGQAAFFADFEFRFSDSELLFMRHAPERFVQMGNADWFDHHGFEQANVSPTSPYALEVRVHRTLPYFEFMEPVVVELKLTNRSDQPMLVDEALLQKADEMTVIIKKNGNNARQWRPFAQCCYHGNQKVLGPGASLYGSLNIAVGTTGWNIAEPGTYTIQIALHLPGEDVVSNAFPVRVAPPRGYDEEFIAQDFFSDDVGRVLAFNGSRHFEGANNTLRTIIDQFGDKRVAKHASLALGNPLTRAYKLLNFEAGNELDVTADDKKRFKVLRCQPEAAQELLSAALIAEPAKAADTLGHIDYTHMVRSYSEFLADEGDPAAAAASLKSAEQTLRERNVLTSVLQKLESERQQYAAAK